MEGATVKEDWNNLGNVDDVKMITPSLFLITRLTSSCFFFLWKCRAFHVPSFKFTTAEEPELQKLCWLSSQHIPETLNSEHKQCLLFVTSFSWQCQAGECVWNLQQDSLKLHSITYKLPRQHVSRTPEFISGSPQTKTSLERTCSTADGNRRNENARCYLWSTELWESWEEPVPAASDNQLEAGIMTHFISICFTKQAVWIAGRLQPEGMNMNVHLL